MEEREREGESLTCNTSCAAAVACCPMFRHIRTLSRYLRAVLWKSSSGNTMYRSISVTESKYTKRNENGTIQSFYPNLSSNKV